MFMVIDAYERSRRIHKEIALNVLRARGEHSLVQTLGFFDGANVRIEGSEIPHRQYDLAMIRREDFALQRNATCQCCLRFCPRACFPIGSTEVVVDSQIVGMVDAYVKASGFFRFFEKCHGFGPVATPLVLRAVIIEFPWRITLTVGNGGQEGTERQAFQYLHVQDGKYLSDPYH